MEYVEASPLDAYEAISLFEALEPDTLAFVELPRCVYVGKGCSLSRNVNLQYCVNNDIPVVRGTAAGRSVSYQGNDNLWLVFTLRELMNLDTLKNILVDVFGNLGVAGFIQDNDVRVGNRRVAMFVLSCQPVVEVCLSVDLEEINRVLRFPPEKWRNKPVNRIEDWLLPLTSLIGSTAKENMKAEVISQVEKHLGVELIGRDLRESELAKVSSLSEKYHSEMWLRHGRWSPVKDYWRPK